MMTMARQTRRLVETRSRGFFGWTFLLLFWGWNLLMVGALFKGVAATNCAELATEAASVCAAGAGLGMMMVLFMWAIGDVVFGMLAFFTRGKREMIEYLD